MARMAEFEERRSPFHLGRRVARKLSRLLVQRVAARAAELTVLHLPGNAVGNRLKFATLRFAGADVCWPLHVDSGLWIRCPSRMKSQPGLVVSRGSVLNCGGGLTFGEKCLVGYGAYIGTTMHRVPSGMSTRVADAGHTFSHVNIGDGAWIGAHAVVLPGVSVGRGSICGAGAVVTHSVADGTIVVGVPARAIRQRKP